MKTSDFKKESDLKSMKVGEIRAHVRTFNDDYAIKGYSKLKKADLISAISKAQLRIAKEKKPKLKVVGTHKMPDGTVMTGKTHSPSSVPVKKPASAKASGSKLTSNRQLVQALLDGAISLLAFRHINKNKSGGSKLTVADREALLKKFQSSPSLKKKLLATKFGGKFSGETNMYGDIATIIKEKEEKLRSNLGRDTATGKLATMESSSRPKAVRELKDYLALPLWKKIEGATAENSFWGGEYERGPIIGTEKTWGDKTRTGSKLYSAMIAIEGDEKPV